MKTMKQWDESGKSFTQFADPKTYVDEDIFDYFLCVLPPHCYERGIMQVGEPYTHIKDKPAFMTFTYSNNKYYYAGILTSQR